jgi:hypothetical protein
MSLAMAWCCGTAASAETKGGDTEKVDANTYSAIRKIRKEIGLSNRTMAAMGCDHAAAKEVFKTLLLWYRVKEPYLHIAKRAKRRASEDLRKALQKIGMGPRDDKLVKSVPTLKAAIARTAKDYDDILKTGISAIEAKLSPAQKAVWATARANSGLPSRYRYVVNMTGAQAKALHVDRRTQARRLASAKTSAGRAAVTSEYKTRQSNVLLAAQKAAMAQAAENIRKNMSAVLKAEPKVLPIPDELKGPDPESLCLVEGTPP